MLNKSIYFIYCTTQNKNECRACRELKAIELYVIAAPAKVLGARI